MKKVTEPEFKRYRIVRLFKDDLDELLHIFNSICKSTEIVIDGYELSDISQLINIKKQRITDFSLRGHLDDPHRSARLSLTSKEASLYLSDNANTLLLGMASQIECILSRRKSITRFLVSSKVRAIGSVILYILFGIIIGTAFSYSWSNGYIYISKLSDYFTRHLALMFLAMILAALPLIWSIWTYRVIKDKYTIIYLVYFDSHTTFFVRNKDQIILLIIGAVIGTFVGSIGTIIVTLLTK